MRVVAVVLTMICLGSAGCSLFDKKDAPAGSPTSAAHSQGNGKSPSSSNDPFYTTNAAQTAPSPSPQPATQPAADQFGGILAGKVVDVLGRPVEDAYVRCVCMDDKDNANPPDAAVVPGGYFRIEGLKPELRYELTARAKIDGQMAAGKVYRSTPESRLVIRIDPKLASAETPPLPGPPVYQGKPATPPKTTGIAPASGDRPSLAVRVPQAPVEFDRVSQIPDLPTSVLVPVASVSPVSTAPTHPAPPQANQGWVPAAPPSPPAMRPLPTLEIAAPRAPAPTIQMQTPIPVPNPFPPPAPMRTPEPTEPAPPPIFPNISSADRLDTPSSNIAPVNFALTDTNGSPWEFRQHQGKLVLLDFWGTFCPPCRETIPKLVALQSKYGGRGLEIVGIACEQNGSDREKARRISDMCQGYGASYRQLLSSGAVLAQFDVRLLPTLVLIDEHGAILWRCVGQPNSADHGQLEQILQRQLLKQP